MAGDLMARMRANAAREKAEQAPPSPVVEPEEDPFHTRHQSLQEPPESFRERRSPRQAPREVVQMLPHDPESEMALLSSALISPVNVMKIIMSAVGDDDGIFYIPAHKTTYRELLNLFEDREPIDIITVTSALKARGVLEKVGGPGFVANLIDYVPTAANAKFYLDRLIEQHVRRTVQADLKAAIDEAVGGEDITAVIAKATAKLQSVGAMAGVRSGVRTIRVRDLDNYNTNADTNSVLGFRWLCRAATALWVGQSGIGKSSLCMQASIRWALGLDLFGVFPTYGRKLKSLIIQAENDEGDLAEMFQGVMKNCPIPDGMTRDQLIAELHDRIFLHQDCVNTGPQFASNVSRLIDEYSPDLVWIDPVHSYTGDDISNQKVASGFLRNMLNPIAARTGVVFNLLHHTGKPSTDPKARAHWTDDDFSYAAFGSSELVNAPRAVNVLRGIGDGRYELRFAKRGGRAGAQAWASSEEERIYTKTVFLRHAEGAIYWDQVAEPTAEEIAELAKGKGRGSDVKYTEQMIIDFMEADNIGRTTVELKKALLDEKGMSKGTFYALWKQVQKNPRVTQKANKRWYVS